MSHKVFICHSSHDKTVADKVCATLESKHIPCWIAPRDVLPGALWGEAVADAIDGSQIVILVLSSNSCNSSQVIREVERAASNNTPIVPLRIDDVAISKAIGFFVSSRHWLDAQTPPLDQHMSRLTDTVRQLLTQERIPQKSIATLGAKYVQSSSVERTVEVTKSGQQVLRCPKCGVELRPNAIFCNKCGTRVDEVEKAKEAEEKAEKETEEARKAKEAEEKAQREAEEARKAKEAEEKAEKEAEEARKAKEAEEKAQREAEEARKAREAEEKAQREAEEARKAREAEEKAQREAEEARKAREAEEKAKKEAEEKAQREAEEAKAGQQVLHCPKCGIELKPNAVFCSECGTRISKVEDEKPDVSVTRPVETIEQVLHCPKCGTELRPNAIFCNKCGTRISKVEDEKPDVSAAETVETLQQVLRCPKCGTELRPNAIFCDNCGTRVNEAKDEK